MRKGVHEQIEVEKHSDHHECNEFTDVADDVGALSGTQIKKFVNLGKKNHFLCELLRFDVVF